MNYPIVKPYVKVALSEIVHRYGSESYAIDLGCGDGVVSRYILSQGWHVCAVDIDGDAVQQLTENLPTMDAVRCSVLHADFCNMEFLPVQLVHASYSLQYVYPLMFRIFWEKIKSCILPGGVFAGHIFGMNDDFSSMAGYSVFDEKSARALFDGFTILMWEEYEGPGQRAPERYWHFYTVVAKRCC